VGRIIARTIQPESNSKGLDNNNNTKNEKNFFFFFNVPPAGKSMNEKIFLASG
jgi:hypothetical protein